jgi:hypothetical protein
LPHWLPDVQEKQIPIPEQLFGAASAENHLRLLREGKTASV